MKLSAFFAVALITLMVSCEKSNTSVPTTQCTVKGRWIDPLGTALYEYTDSLRYTIYQTAPGQFGTIADAIPNPEKWWLQGDTLVLKTGSNSFKAHVAFDCNCKIMRLTASYNGTTWTNNLRKEGVDTTICP